MTEFARLLTLADDVGLSCISTAEGFRNHLSRRQEVLALRRALEAGAISFDDVQVFIQGLLAGFVRGGRSHAEVVIAAVVVAIEPLTLPGIDEFLVDLARVKVAEMPMSPRVARLSRRERSARLAQLTQRELVIANLPQPTWPPREDRPSRVDVGVDYGIHNLQEVA